jgi:hypothetical protein
LSAGAGAGAGTGAGAGLWSLAVEALQYDGSCDAAPPFFHPTVLCGFACLDLSHRPLLPPRLTRQHFGVFGLFACLAPIFGDWGLFGFPFAIIIGGDPLGFLSKTLLDGLLPLRLSVPSRFFFGALLDFAPVSLSDSLSARIRLVASSVSVPRSDMFFLLSAVPTG